MITRLRPAHTPEQLAEIYATPHDHRIYGRGHHERVETTIAMALGHLERYQRLEIGDLSCGNGQIALRIASGDSATEGFLALGDIAAGYEFCGPIEQTIHEVPHVQVFVCSETLEHLDNPTKVLTLIRTKAEHLVLSTPLECWNDTNGEHYWAWDRADVEDLLHHVGWEIEAFDSVDSREYGEPYLFGIWVCS